MRILQLCNKPPFPPTDGGSHAMLNLSQAFIKLGHEVTVLAMNTDKHKITPDQLFQFNKIMHAYTVYVNTHITGWSLVKNLLFSRIPFTASRFISDAFSHKLIGLLQSQTFDIVQLEGAYMLPYVKTIRAHSQAKIALRSHNIEHEIWKRITNQERSFFRKVYFGMLTNRIRLFEKKSLNTYDLLVPITERDLNKYNEMGNLKPAVVCHAGVNVSENIPKNAVKQEFSLYFLGSLDWIPNQDGILWFISKVFPILLTRHPGLKFHIAGRNAPETLIRKFNHPNIIYHGEVPDSRQFSSEHSVLISPCFAGGGMRVKIIEAMSLGKAVITTTIGAEGISIDHNMNILIANTSSEFAGCIEAILKYPHVGEQIGKNALAFINKNYNILNIAQSLSEFYKNNLKQHD